MYRITILKLALGALTVVVCGLLLAAVVSFILAFVALAEGNPWLFLQSFLAGSLSLGFAWLIGEGVRRMKDRSIDLQIAEYARAAHADPPDYMYHCRQGFVFAQQNEFTRAIAHYDLAIGLVPTDPYAYIGRVNAYGALGRFQRMIAEYTAAIERDPGDALAWCARATAYNGQGRFDRSLCDATRAIELAPELYLGYDARGYGYLQRGSYSWALKLVAVGWLLASLRFLRRDPFDWRTPTGSPADFEQSIADFTVAIQLNPRAWDCYFGRARAYRALGELVKAIADETMVHEVKLRESLGLGK